MEKVIAYLHQISPLNKEMNHSLSKLFNPTRLKEEEFFIDEEKYAKEIGFLETGIARAFFVNQDGKEYRANFDWWNLLPHIV
jgi:hypothetical protein